MKRMLTLLLALGLLCGTAFAEEFIEAEEAAVEEIFAVQSEEEPLEVQPEETFAAEELIPEESVETVEIAVEELTEAMTEASVPEDPAAPAAVTGIKGVPVYTNAARISWDAMSGVTGFQLFRADKEDGEFKWVKNNPTTTVVNYVLTPGADYWYKVRAYTEDKDGKKQYGPFSDVVKVHNLGAIENFTVQPKDTNCSFLKWDKVPGCTGYQVFRTVAGSGEYQWVKNATTNQVANYSLTPGTTYYYKLRAYVDLPDGSRAYGQYSDGIKVEIMAAARITSISCNDAVITLSWEQQQQISGYQVFYTIAGTGGQYTWLTNTSKTTWVHSGLSAGKTYYYLVRSYRNLPDGTRAYGQYSPAVSCKAIPLFEFTSDGSNGLRLKHYNGGASQVVIPSTYEGKKVTGIGSKAFYGNEYVQKVVIPATVRTIGEYAFGACYGLASITIPDSVTTIEAWAFSGSSLTSIVLPDSVVSLGEQVFNTCSCLQSVKLPNGIGSIPDGMLYNCMNLSSFTIPDTVTSIGASAFEYCQNLSDLAIPGSVTSIGERAFAECPNLTEMTIPGSVRTIPRSLFFECWHLESVTMLDGVTSIGVSAFASCQDLTVVSIPNGVTTIGLGAFSGCTSLESITIPASVTSIGSAAFSGCSRNFCLSAPAGSYALQWAEENRISCTAL